MSHAVWEAYLALLNTMTVATALVILISTADDFFLDAFYWVRELWLWRSTSRLPATISAQTLREREERYLAIGGLSARSPCGLFRPAPLPQMPSAECRHASAVRRAGFYAAGMTQPPSWQRGTALPCASAVPQRSAVQQTRMSLTRERCSTVRCTA